MLAGMRRVLPLGRLRKIPNKSLLTCAGSEGGSLLADTYESATVPRFGQVVLSAKAVSSLSAVVDQIRKLKGGPPSALRYRVTGRFGLSGGGSIPFDQRGEIGF